MRHITLQKNSGRISIQMTGKLEWLVEDLKAVKVATKANRFRLILMLFWANAKSASEHNYSNAPSQTARAAEYHMWVGP